MAVGGGGGGVDGFGMRGVGEGLVLVFEDGTRVGGRLEHHDMSGMGMVLRMRVTRYYLL